MVFKHTLIKIALGWDTPTPKKKKLNPKETTTTAKQANNNHLTTATIAPTMIEDALSRQRLQTYATTTHTQPPRFSEHFDLEPTNIQHAVEPRAFIDGGRWA
jgi:hypothetical protein